jgi:DNA-binding HxlR family transcriptional regulator
MKQRDAKCPAEYTLAVIGGRWKVLILFQLFQGVKRFSELQRALKGITQKMLTQQLRELERDRVVLRTVYPQVPPKVEYRLTSLGDTLKPVVHAMCKWGARQAGQASCKAGDDGKKCVNEEKRQTAS